MLFRVALTVKPSALEEQAGKTERAVLPTVEVIANGEKEAVAIAVFQNADKIKDEDISRVTVYTSKSY